MSEVQRMIAENWALRWSPKVSTKCRHRQSHHRAGCLACATGEELRALDPTGAGTISHEDPAFAAACEVGRGFPDSSSHSVKLPSCSSLEDT